MNRSPLLPLASSLALLFLTSRARASPTYPQVMVEETASLTGKTIPQPACTVCHIRSTGGNGTVVTDFGLAMQDFGAQGNSPDTLRAAWAEAVAENWDSDGDGIPDVEELVAGSDLNDGPGRESRVPRPQHGCAAASGRPTPNRAAVLLIVLVVIGLRKKRGAARGSHPLGLTALAVAAMSTGCGVADGADPWLCPRCLGSVIATVDIDVCPTISSYTIFPSRAPVGTQFDLRAVATDPDTRQLSFSWTADIGIVADPNAAHTTYRCAEPGLATLVLTASDGICDDAARDSIECTP